MVIVKIWYIYFNSKGLVMFRKQRLFSLLAVGCVAGNAVAMNEPQPKVFDKANDTQVVGNPLFLWFATGGQLNPSPEFEKTLVVEYQEDGTYSEAVSLRDIKTNRFKKNHPVGRTSKRFNKHIKANNAIECPNFTQLPNRDGELKNVAAIIYGTQNTSHCERYKQWLQGEEIVNNTVATPGVTVEPIGGAFGGFFNGFYKLLDEKIQ